MIAPHRLPGRLAAALLVALTASSAAGTPPPPDADAASHDAVLEGLAPHAEWVIGGAPVAFAHTELRRIGDFAHVRTVVTHPDGSPIDPEQHVWIRAAAVPLTLSAVLRRRGDRWLFLDADFALPDTVDRDARFRAWPLPGGLLPPD